MTMMTDCFVTECRRRSFTNFAPSSTIVHNSLLCTFRSCAWRSWTVRVVVTCAQLVAVMCKSSQLVLLLVVLTASLHVLQALEQPSNHTSTLVT